MIGLLPALLLAICPIRMFRSHLNNILGGHTSTALNIFVEKLYSCYRDGLDGGKDVREELCIFVFVCQSGKFSPFCLFMVILGHTLWYMLSSDCTCSTI